MCWGLISCRKVKYIWCAHFHEIISTNMQFGIDLFVFTYTVTFKQKFPNSHYFFFNYCKRLTVMCAPRNDKYIPSFSKTKLSIKCLLCTWILCFSSFSFFAFWGAEKHVFPIAPFWPTRYVLKGFRYLEVRNRLGYWNKVKTSFSWGRNYNYANWKYQYS